MRVVAALTAVLAVGCDNVSPDDTVFKCDADNPCPGDQVCSGASGICLDHAVLFYEDFENGLDASRWFVTEQMGTVEVDETAGHWGEAAVRTSSTVGGGAVSIEHTFDAVLPPRLFLRLFIQQADATPYAPHLILGDQAGSIALNMHGEQGKLFYKVTRDSDSRMTEGARVTANTWMCIEIEIDGPATGDAEGNVKVYFDDVEDTAMRLVAPLRAFDTLELGGYSMAPMQTLFDDVILDTQRVGCTR